MLENGKYWRALTATMLMGLLAGGCATIPKGPQTIRVQPTKAPRYGFLAEDAQLKDRLAELYENPRSAPLTLSVYVSEPVGETMMVSGNKPFRMAPQEQAVTLQMHPGVYPFTLKSGEDQEAEQMTGALAVFNIDKTMELATFGHTPETQVFNPDLLSKARQGVLTNYTVSFDGQPRLVYWLGNRQGLFLGGDPTVELDFGGNAGIKELVVNDQKPALSG